MSGSATWIDICPICKGLMKLDILDKKAKKLFPSVDCPVCVGKGNIMVKHVVGRK
jgi:hypothetical protein